ncbi:MAG: hypothetical protein HDS11_04050 [Bacteroides sp.]|nr:hypothetical protein [Bacteroides sp.]
MKRINNYELKRLRELYDLAQLKKYRRELKRGLLKISANYSPSYLKTEEDRQTEIEEVTDILRKNREYNRLYKKLYESKNRAFIPPITNYPDIPNPLVENLDKNTIFLDPKNELFYDKSDEFFNDYIE